MKQLVEVAALFVGGWWAYSKFIRIEEPATKRNFATEQHMEWADSPQPAACYAMLTVTFQNISKSDVHIEKAIQRAWIMPLPSFEGAISYVDPDQLTHGKATDSVSYTDGPFVQDYPPQAKVRYDLVWTLKRASGIALFRVDLYADSTDDEPIDWVYDWDEICGASGSDSKTK